jgi:methyl-accepting chemotaxis protein
VNLRIRILAILLLVVVLVTLVLVWAGISTQRLIEERFAETTEHGRALVWRGVISDEVDSLTAVVTRMTRDRDLKKALAKMDRDKANEQIQPIYSMLAAQGMVDRVGAFDAAGNYMATQGYAGEGTALNLAIRKSLTDGKVVSGVVVDDDGALMVAVATPLARRGKSIGGGILMRSLEGAVKQFNRRTEIEIALFVDDDLVWSANETFAAVVPDASNIPAFGVVDHDGSAYVVTRHPVMDIQGNGVASLVVAEDLTASIHKQRQQNLLAIIASLLVVGISLLLSYFVLTRMLHPLVEVSGALQRIAEGDLGIDIEERSGSEIGVLERAAHLMVTHLRELIKQIQDVTDLVAERSLVMKDSSRKGLETAGKQLDKVQEISDAVSRMEQASREVESQAVAAFERTNQVDGEVDASRQVVADSIRDIHRLAEHIQESAAVINRLRDKSSNISNFLSMIQDVAEQTNLLALNAAIESARAGEQGRGFAVVADEVRALSLRTTQSTREIQSLTDELQGLSGEAVTSIENSVIIAKQSVENTDQTNKSLAKIVTSVDEIRDMSGSISRIASEQHQMTGGIFDAVSGVADATRNSESQAHEVVSSCERLAEVATRLRALVGRFHS